MIKQVLALTLLLTAATAEARDRTVQSGKLQQEPAATSPRAQLQYFGFYASAMGSWNFTHELAPFTNLTWIHLGTAEDPAAAIPGIVQRLEQARDAGIRAVISIEPFLFLNPRGKLRTDIEIEDLLVEMRAQIEARGLMDTVAMLYPKDEPFRQFKRHRDPSYVSEYITGEVYRDIHADLVHANDLLKSVFPEKPIGVILSGYDLHHRFFSIPENYDWVGYNCYSSLYRGCGSDRGAVGHYERLLAFMQPHQRLIAVPETWAKNEYLDRADWPEVLLRRFRHHYEIALSEPRFIAFIPFIWSFEYGGETPGLGLDRFEDLYDDGISDTGSAFVEAVIDAGLQVKDGAFRYPNLAWAETEDHAQRPTQRIRAGINGVTRDGRVSAWAVDDSLPHKNLRVQVRLRDHRGRLLHKSPVFRTDVVDHGKGVATTLGLHGIRYRLPADLLKRQRFRPPTVELVVYADGMIGNTTRPATVRQDL